MHERLKQIPVYSSYETELAAPIYNHVQYALNHLGEGIQFRIPELWHLDLVLEKPAWIIIDRTLGDFPVAAWTDFQTKNRENLHEPIKCQQNIYHAFARAILEKTVKSIDTLIDQQLEDKLIAAGATVTSLKRKEDVK